MQILASIVIYFLAQRVAKTGTISAWRVIQFFLGGMTIFCGILDLVLIGTPQEVWWLSKEQKVIAHARVAVNASTYMSYDPTLTSLSWRSGEPCVEVVAGPRVLSRPTVLHLSVVQLSGDDSERRHHHVQHVDHEVV